MAALTPELLGMIDTPLENLNNDGLEKYVSPSLVALN